MSRISPQTMHELVGLTARLSAIVRLVNRGKNSVLPVSDSEPALDPAQLSRDFEAALLKLGPTWKKAMHERCGSDS
jgi:hypothetical protein